MKKNLFTIFAISGLCLALSAPLLAGSSSAFVVNIPVDFMIGNATLPAGKYIFEPFDKALKIRRAGGQETASLTAMPISDEAVNGSARVVLHQQGDTYFLYQVWKPGSSAGYQLPMSPRERELAKGNSKPRVESFVAQKQ